MDGVFFQVGARKSDFDDYDTAFYSLIKEKVTRYETESFATKFELDYQLLLRK